MLLAVVTLTLSSISRFESVSKVPRYSKSVLLVDDSHSDLLLFKRLLEKAHFRVIATSNADAALSSIVSGDIGCLVTDQVMQISSQELLSLVRSVRSDVGVIFISGADAPREPLPPGIVFIRKHDKKKLIEMVASCMSKYRAA